MEVGSGMSVISGYMVWRTSINSAWTSASDSDSIRSDQSPYDGHIRMVQMLK